MAGVNGAALHWSTAATLGAAGQAVAALPLSAIAGVNGPAAAPLVVGPMLIGPPAPAVGLPLAVALDRIKNNALGAMLSALMLSCDPPVGQRQGWTGAPPPWWPTAAEDWWVPEVVAHLNTMPAHTPVPFAPAYKLKKVQKVGVLVAVVKHLSPDFDGISEKVEVSQNAKAKLTAEEKNLWKSALENEAARHKSGSVPMVPVFNFVLQQQQQQAPPPPPPHGDGHRLAPIGGATTENVVRGGVAVAAADGREQQVVNVNLAGASVTAPAGDGGQAVAAAETEQHGDGALHGGAMAADGGSEKPVDIP
uniref:Ethylene insensitive 3-like DNA-binding domain-containing protein n=1 Tax=Setaria italica TaxID=4555 RepID=K4A2T8_SETIT